MREGGMAATTSAGPLEPFTTFGALLKYLRVRARLNQTELAIAVGYSTAQISRLELNTRLPDLIMLVALFVPALDLQDEPETVARLLELAAAARGDRVPGRRVTSSDTAWQTTVDSGLEHEIDQPVAASSSEERRSQAPVPPTPLVGRETEVYAVHERLLRPEVRLLT